MRQPTNAQHCSHVPMRIVLHGIVHTKVRQYALSNDRDVDAIVCRLAYVYTHR